MWNDDEGLPPQARCGSYASGHELHHIPAMKSFRDRAQHRDVEVVAIDGTQVVLRGRDDDEVLVRYFHDPVYLAALAATRPDAVTYDPRWGVLGFTAADGGSIRQCKLAAVPVEPCPPPADDTSDVVAPSPVATAELAERAQRDGGAVLAARAVARPDAVGPSTGAASD